MNECFPFVSIIHFFCRFSLNSGLFVDLTDWIELIFNTLVVKTVVSSLYIGRLQIPKNTVMRIENAKFTVEGQVFFCERSMHNQTERSCR